MLFSEVFVDNWLLEVFGESVPLEKVNIPNERTSVSGGNSVGDRLVSKGRMKNPSVFCGASCVLGLWN